MSHVSIARRWWQMAKRGRGQQARLRGVVDGSDGVCQPVGPLHRVVQGPGPARQYAQDQDLCAGHLLPHVGHHMPQPACTAHSKRSSMMRTYMAMCFPSPSEIRSTEPTWQQRMPVLVGPPRHALAGMQPLCLQGFTTAPGRGAKGSGGVVRLRHEAGLRVAEVVRANQNHHRLGRRRDWQLAVLNAPQQICCGVTWQRKCRCMGPFVALFASALSAIPLSARSRRLQHKTLQIFPQACLK